ncbi:MAG: PEGA domain-containing protein, partial [Methanospirillum sp.]|nr:PEGA domain-containing protein [Methanospirillum sp.]
AGVGYYKAEYISDTIPLSLEAGSTYPVVITFRNTGMVSWEWGVEKFGLLYQGLQSSIIVDPIFSPIPQGVKVASQREISFPLTLTPPDKPGEYELSFSMSTRKGETRYEPFADSFTKTIQIIPKEGVSSGSVGSIIINSVPDGAVVRMGSEEKGKTPLTFPDLNPATYELTIKHPDFPSKWTKVQVQAGSVTRVDVNLESEEKPLVSTEHLMKYTLLGWFLDNLPILVICLVIIFLGFQVMMMDTKHVPENHPLRRMAQPILLLSPPADGKSRWRRGGDKQGKGDGTGKESDSGEIQDRSGTGKTGKSRGSNGKTGKIVHDRSIRRDTGTGGLKSPEAADEEPEISVTDPDQEGKEMEGMWGFPHALRDRYDPLGVAGDDPYARVYKVRKKESGDVRALKIGHMKHEGSEILQKETAVWRSLRHPNIVRLFRSEFLDDMTYLENEYLDGVQYHGVSHTSLSGLPKPLREQYAVSLIRDIAEGLKYAHQIGVRHYHIQPGNILLTPKLRAKLSGFARGKSELGFSIPDSDVREADAAYITPEQRKETDYGNPGKRTDIYQIGVIFYELLTGYLPYSHEAYEKADRAGLFENHSDLLVLPSEIRKNLSAYDPIISRMLSLQKTGRYGSIEEFLADLDQVPGPDR